MGHETPVAQKPPLHGAWCPFRPIWQITVIITYAERHTTGIKVAYMSTCSLRSAMVIVKGHVSVELQFSTIYCHNEKQRRRNLAFVCHLHETVQVIHCLGYLKAMLKNTDWIIKYHTKSIFDGKIMSIFF